MSEVLSGKVANISGGTRGIGPAMDRRLKHFPNREHLLEKNKERTPLGPTFTPERVVDAIYLLRLSESSTVAGHTLLVDGGLAISG